MRIHKRETIFYRNCWYCCQGQYAAGTGVVFHGITRLLISNGTESLLCTQRQRPKHQQQSYAYSDIKLKENIVDADSQWDDLKALQVRNWNFKAETAMKPTAKSAYRSRAELVSPGWSANRLTATKTATSWHRHQSVNQSVLYMKAVKALQEAMERIETLQGMVAVNNITIDEQQHQISALAARLTALESA
jgi:uncharacterized coiled-coil protein SlyX